MCIRHSDIKDTNLTSNERLTYALCPKDVAKSEQHDVFLNSLYLSNHCTLFISRVLRVTSDYYVTVLPEEHEGHFYIFCAIASFISGHTLVLPGGYVWYTGM